MQNTFYNVTHGQTSRSATLRPRFDRATQVLCSLLSEAKSRLAPGSSVLRNAGYALHTTFIFSPACPDTSGAAGRGSLQLKQGLNMR